MYIDKPDWWQYVSITWIDDVRYANLVLTAVSKYHTKTLTDMKPKISLVASYAINYLQNFRFQDA